MEVVGGLTAFYASGLVVWMREVRLGRMGAEDFVLVATGPFLLVYALRGLPLRFQEWYAPKP